MRKRKLFQTCMAGALSAAMLTSGVSVWGAEFSDGAQDIAVEAAETPVMEDEDFTADTEDAAVMAAEEMPILDDEEFTAEAAEASEIPISKSPNYFPDQPFRKYITDVVDTNKNGKLSTTEIAAVKTMNLKGLGIKNLKGIERFPKLEGLYAADNELETVDLTKNTYLQNINLSGNNLTGTLNLSKCTRMVTVNYSDNELTRVVMPAAKYLSKLQMIDASGNRFTNQTYAGLYYKYINGDVMESLTEVDASDNQLTEFCTNGCRAMILDLRNNKITKFTGGSGGFQSLGIYLDGKYNTLKSTSKIDFSALGNVVPQRFSCNSSVKSKVVMTTPKLSVSPDWDEIKVSVGASTDDVSYKLERKTGSGSYKTVKTWEAGELDDPEFGENQVVETDITPGTSYTYRLTTTAMVQNADKVLTAWPSSVEKTVVAAPAAPSVRTKAKGKGEVAIAWDAVPGADGYRVYYGTTSTAKSPITKKTTDLTIRKKGLKSGSYYYFRVCAYKVVDGKTYLAPFSTSVKCKVK